MSLSDRHKQVVVPAEVMNWALGRTIQVIRIDRGFSRRQLAERSGISYSYLSAIENGTKEPSGKIRMLIARALGLWPHELMAAAEARALGEMEEGGDTLLVGNVTGPFEDRFIAPAEELDEMLDEADIRRWYRYAQRMGLPIDAPGRPAAATGALAELGELLNNMAPEDVERVLDLARRLAPPGDKT